MDTRQHLENAYKLLEQNKNQENIYWVMDVLSDIQSALMVVTDAEKILGRPIDQLRVKK